MAHPLQKKIQTLLNILVLEGKERGAQVAIYQNGELIVDAWAGIADCRTGALVEGDTLFPVFSCTKGVMATVIHLLAERGKIEYDQPVAHYWPEFGANGKEAITVRHVLAHTAGIPFMPEGLTNEQVCDFAFMRQAIAQLKPFWAPGANQVYHPLTYGWILANLSWIVDGRPFQPLIEAEICGPLGISGSMFSGIPDDVESRVARLEIFPDEPPKLPPPPNDIALCMVPLHQWMNRPDARRTCQPACNGLMSARALARHYAALLPGGVDGVELLPRERVRLAAEEQVPAKGYDVNNATRRGLGYQREAEIKGIDKNEPASPFGHGGYGGSIGMADPRFGLALAVVRNRFSSEDLRFHVRTEIGKFLGIV
jgi:CubicO group peptidase (beta-lactamase class C family)